MLMTVFEIITIMLRIIDVLISLGMLLIAFLTFFSKKK